MKKCIVFPKAISKTCVCVCTRIITVTHVAHTGSNALQNLSHRPAFYNPIKTSVNPINNCLLFPLVLTFVALYATS